MPKSKLLLRDSLAFAKTRIPYEVRAELRRDTRFSLTQKKAYLRVPIGMPRPKLEQTVAEFKTWLKKAAAKRPDLAAAHEPMHYESGQVWRLGQYTYRLQLSEGALQGASAKPAGRTDEDGITQLSLKLGAGLSATQRAEAIEKLLYKSAAREAHPHVWGLLEQINAAHFRVPVSRLKLSPTRSRWGSCSASGTISISSLLLGAPARALHAVLVHELAHGIEMNHSDRFWKLVYDAMPDYEVAHRWLREHGRGLGWGLQVLNE